MHSSLNRAGTQRPSQLLPHVLRDVPEPLLGSRSAAEKPAFAESVILRASAPGKSSSKNPLAFKGILSYPASLRLAPRAALHFTSPGGSRSRLPGESGDPPERDRLWVRGSPPHRRRELAVGRRRQVRRTARRRAAASHSQGREPLEYGRNPRFAPEGRRAPRSGATALGTYEVCRRGTRLRGVGASPDRTARRAEARRWATPLRGVNGPPDRTAGRAPARHVSPVVRGPPASRSAACRLAPPGGSYRDRTTQGARSPPSAGLR